VILLAIALILTPARCEAIARETVTVCRWPNIDGAHGRQCDRLNTLQEACKRKGHQ
jgi:hypothetical protein